MIRPAITPGIAPVPANLPNVDAGVIWEVLKPVIPTAALILGCSARSSPGIATPPEASGVGALGAMLLALCNWLSQCMFGVFLLGAFLDWVEITPIVLPLVAPLVQSLGFDLIWFTILFAVRLQTSFLTPPVGFALF